jgi:hypothetical protein
MKTLNRQLMLFLICFSINFLAVAQSSIDSLAVKKSYYHSAMNEIKDMLDGKTPLSYEKAIFLMENAYYENKISYEVFQNTIDYYSDKIKFLSECRRENPLITKSLLETENDQLKNHNTASLNYAIFSFITDTTDLLERFDSTAKKLYFKKHFPCQYSITDPFGTEDWKNTQIINLIKNHTGNCFAFSSLFKVFSERLSTNANLCTAPGHVYIKHANNKGIYFNVELATRAFPGTGSLKMLTYTTNDALKNDLSLRELDLKQSVVLCLVYLAKGYEYKFGIKSDEFTLQLAELALRHDAFSLNAMLLKAGILEEKLLRSQTNLAQAKKEIDFKEYEQLISKLYTLGYREMPLEMKNLIVSELKKDSVTFIVKNHTPQPYKSIGIKDSRYATLSWGMFEEIHEVKPFEQYNRTVFDTKSNKISNFVKPSNLYNDYNFDPVVFALSIDPLAAKYPHQSPYTAFNNNPIYYNDPDGKEGVGVVDHKNKTITIKAVYYTEVGKDGFSTENLEQLRGINTSLNAQGYQVTDEANALHGYTVQFDLQFVPVPSERAAQKYAVSEVVFTAAEATGGKNLIEGGNNIANSLILTDDATFEAIPSIVTTAEAWDADQKM